MPWMSIFLLGLTAIGVPLDAQVAGPHGVIRGVVLDGATTGLLARVLVIDEASGAAAVTDAEGRFDLKVPPGVRRVVASAIGYSLAQRDVEVGAGGFVDVTIALAGGTGAYSETVTVSADRFRSADP
jgi:Carboxypeptidase regulatory-like domain